MFVVKTTKVYRQSSREFDLKRKVHKICISKVQIIVKPLLFVEIKELLLLRIFAARR